MSITWQLGAAVLCSLLLTLALAPAALAVSAGIVTYDGTTSQTGKFELSVTHPKNGSVEAVGIQWKARCESHLQSIHSTTIFRPQPDKVSNGSFSGKARFISYIGGTNGDQGHLTVSVAGHTTSTKASGTFAGHAVIYKRSTQVTTCSSGHVTWHATRI